MNSCTFNFCEQKGLVVNFVTSLQEGQLGGQSLGLVPHSKDVHIRLTSNSKLAIDVTLQWFVKQQSCVDDEGIFAHTGLIL